jgi:hypothetical protein
MSQMRNSMSRELREVSRRSKWLLKISAKFRTYVEAYCLRKHALEQCSAKLSSDFAVFGRFLYIFSKIKIVLNGDCSLRTSSQL